MIEAAEGQIEPEQNFARYQRQMMLPMMGEAGQQAISGAHIFMVGAGGLGVPALQYLVGAGIGKITLVDPDIVEESNLHRQPIYGAHIGDKKVAAAAAQMRLLNPDVQIVPIAEWLTPANARRWVAEADVVMDCADSYAVSYTLSDLCLAAGKPLISSSVIGTGGYVGGFCQSAPSLRALFPDLPTQLATCDTAGVLGPVVGMFGLIQAQMALAVILLQQPSPLGQLLRYDMPSFRSSAFRFDGAQEPQEPPHKFIAAEQVSPQDWVVELRGEAEKPDLIFPFAQRMVNWDFSAENLGDDQGRNPSSNQSRNQVPDHDQRAVFICRSGLRAWKAADQLRRHWRGPIALLADGSTPSS